jgi:flagellar protein FliL
MFLQQPNSLKNSKDKNTKKDDADESEVKKDASAGEGGEGEDGAAPVKKGLGKKMILIIAAAAVLILGGGGAGLYFSGILDGKKDDAKEAHAKDGDAHGEEGDHAKGDGEGHGEKEDKEAHAAFVDLGDMLVNLSGDGKRQNYLKVKIAIEIADDKDLPKLQSIKPRIIDNFQVYLRELRVEDLKGSAGLYRLREELLLRVTEAAQPVRIKDVLFQEMLVQ